MDRQRCVIGAVVQQADPATVALGFPKIAAAAKSNITTDIPLRDISAWVQLSQRVQKAHVRSLPFTDAVIDTTNPDFAKMRALVQKAISDVPEATPSPSVAPSPSSTKKPSSKPTPPTPAEASKAQDVTSACK
jgi:anionic cell wall polymer biosynthesis LytR-Cps2A-Psr (LCP) family protein